MSGNGSSKFNVIAPKEVAEITRVLQMGELHHELDAVGQPNPTAILVGSSLSGPAIVSE
jgi:hypothetical protein